MDVNSIINQMPSPYNGENEITGATGSFTATGADGQILNVSVENGLITQII